MPAADEPSDLTGDDEGAPAADEIAGPDSATEPETHDDRAMLTRIALFAAFFAVVLALRAWVVEPVRVNADSMSPTLRGGDALIIDKLSYRFREPRRGEIVTTRDPQSGTSIVKRVVAVEGDSVGLEDGLLVLNGEIVEETYTDQEQMDGYFYGPITVPDGEVFLLGDHRFESSDSRQFGTIPVDDIDGRYVLRIWPL